MKFERPLVGFGGKKTDDPFDRVAEPLIQPVSNNLRPSHSGFSLPADYTRASGKQEGARRTFTG
jgi:hypothetical protein